MNLLILSYHDPGSNTIGAVRVRKFAENIASSGSSVKVLSRVGVTSYEPGAPPVEAPGPRLDVEVPRVSRAPNVGTMAHQDWIRGQAMRLWSKARPAVVWLVRHVIVPDVEVFTMRTLFRHSRGLGKWTPQIIVVSGPPFSVFFVAQRMARQRGIPWVADYRDLWTQSGYYVLGPARRMLDTALESRLLKTVSLVTTVSQPLADEMHCAFGVRSEVVFNGYDPSDLPALTLVSNLYSGLPLRILYTGRIYEGKRDPEPLFIALASMGLGPEQVLVEFHGDNVQLVEDAAQRHGVEHLISCGPQLPHTESLALQQRADVLLLLMWNNPGESGVYTGKLFEYLGVRRPILMLGFPGGVAAELIRNRDAGVIANDPDEIAAAVSAWLEVKRETGFVPILPVTVSAGLTRQEQSERLQRLCQALISSAVERM